METGDLLVQVRVHRVDPQLDLVRASRGPRREAFPAMPTPQETNLGDYRLFDRIKIANLSEIEGERPGSKRAGAIEWIRHAKQRKNTDRPRGKK